ncbi:hypothetical protein AB1N83_006446 [Pleurotus pulmonarius]
MRTEIYRSLNSPEHLPYSRLLDLRRLYATVAVTGSRQISASHLRTITTRYEVFYPFRRHCNDAYLGLGFERVTSRAPAGAASTGRHPLLARL